MVTTVRHDVVAVAAPSTHAAVKVAGVFIHAITVGQAAILYRGWQGALIEVSQAATLRTGVTVAAVFIFDAAVFFLREDAEAGEVTPGLGADRGSLWEHASRR